jgi:hypothetical protein
MELEAVAVPLGQTADALKGRQLWARLVAEWVPAAVLKAPKAECELVFFGGCVKVGWHGVVPWKNSQ